MPRIHSAKKSWPHDVYRCYDEAGALLYVGISLNGYQRLGAHRYTAHWWSAVKRVRIEQYRSRHQALVVEAHAIAAEAPLHNRQRDAGRALLPLPAATLDVDEFEVA